MVVEGCNSDWLPVASGVPQGSVLGPLLFLLYINDMLSTVQNSTVSLFADDSKCFNSIKNISDCKLLQKYIDSLYSWSVKWDLHFNTSSAKLFPYLGVHNWYDFDYELNISLERTDSVRDLGVDISSGFIWNDRVNRIVGKCNKMTGLITSINGYEAPVRVSKTLYSALIRSNLEYCSSVWSGTSKRNIRLIEGVQRRATKFSRGRCSDLLPRHVLSPVLRSFCCVFNSFIANLVLYQCDCDHARKLVENENRGEMSQLPVYQDKILT